MSFCDDCRSLDLSTRLKVTKGTVQTAQTSDEQDLRKWTLKSLRKSAETCDLCQLFLKAVHFHDRMLPETPPDNLLCRLVIKDYGDILSMQSGEIIPPEILLGYESNDVEQILRLYIYVETLNQARPLMLPCGFQMKAPDSSVNRSTVLRGRVVDSQVDNSLLLKWIKMCPEFHGSICAPARILDETDNLKMRVIDIERLCIVDLPRDAEYVALSYVWGNAQQQLLLLENLEELTQPFGIREIAGKLPKTIRDAMNLVEQLGQRFLWVDAMCIIQDDPVDLDVQIQHMNVVYGCATLTVVAASGSDSNAGLPGLNSNSRKLLAIDQEIQGVRLITSLPDFTRSLGDSVWDSRGWTMQEKVLSKHLLIFTEYQIFYHCNSATWCEDAIWESQDPYIQLSPGIDISSPDNASRALPHHSFTGLRKYSHFVTDYRSRQLSYQSDALNAFMGALTALGRELNTSFIWGLPESAFNDTLLWRSPIQKASLRREQFPSWTWLGWKDSVLPGLMRFPTVDAEHVETVGHVQWHRVTSDGSQQLIGPSPTTYFELPRFDDSMAPKVPPQNLLRFRARSAYLFVGREPKADDARESTFARYGCPNYIVGLQNEDGKVTHLSSISLHEDWRRSQPDLLEFILICERRTRNPWDKGEVVEGLDLMLFLKRGGSIFGLFGEW
ncbi:HET-domain-containing protein [Hyaloscypha variabilis F]|uniref:HET-domain-containing protein n=1 Tax=Hyaloscypha variabilis (strain UAMH 11265 / GT02V1 / F) TaxID=1149755 RepID=A0A2J6RW95_HYAVF|nr:HET-domain-containing protein [Hyaloscypha variabilis F]